MTETTTSRGRPKAKITKNNYLQAYFYFSNAIQEYRLDVFVDDKQSEGEVIFTALKLTSKITEEKLEKFQEWINTHIQESTWQKCLHAIRQKEYNKRRNTKTLQISGEVYTQLKDCARRMGNKTLEGAIKSLVGKRITKFRK